MMERVGLNANAIVAKLNYKLNTANNTKKSFNVNNIKNTKKQYFTMLFTGDIEEDAEKDLVKIYGNKLKSDILKVAHHGSKTSSIQEFLEAVKPQIALIGVGQNNTFGHPNSDVIEKLEKINTKIYRTDINGEISIKVNKNGEIKINTMLVQ